MNPRRISFVVLLGLLSLPAAPAVAQEEPDETSSIDLPDKKDKDEEKKDKEKEDKPLEVYGSLTSELHTMNNLDLRPRNETSDQSIIESDDRNTFGYTSGSFGVEYDVIEEVEIDFAANHSGLWGSDQLGGFSYEAVPGEPNAAAHWIWIYEMAVSWEAVSNDMVDLEVTVGRHGFEIGGVEDDYFFDDIHDGATVEVDAKEIGTVRLTAGFHGANGAPDDVEFGRYVASHGNVQRFRGDTNTYRFGGVYQNTKLLDGLDVRAFGFYSDIGASTGGNATGADRSYAGALGNFSDSDYVWMAGARGGYTLKEDTFELGAFGEFAYSGGIDRKDTQIGLFDVATEGTAFGAGVHGEVEFGESVLDAKIRAFRASGGQYGRENGVQFNHGFTSFKGDEVGGLNLDRYAGWHPSAYVSSDGIDDTPNALNRKSGTQFLQGGVGLDLMNKFGIRADAWYLMDTSSTNFNHENLDAVAGDLPFGYTEADLEAQRRFGKPLGLEVDLSLNYRPNDVLAFYARGGMFLPSSFYKTEIQRTVQGDNTALGHPSPRNFWAAAVGTSVRF